MKSLQEQPGIIVQIQDPRNIVRTTVPQIAQLTGKNETTVRRWVRQGKIPGVKVGWGWLIIFDKTDPPDLLASYLA